MTDNLSQAFDISKFQSFVAWIESRLVLAYRGTSLRILRRDLFVESDQPLAFHVASISILLNQDSLLQSSEPPYSCRSAG